MKYRCISQNTLLRNCQERVRYEVYLFHVIMLKLRRNGKVISHGSYNECIQQFDQETPTPLDEREGSGTIILRGLSLR